MKPGDIVKLNTWRFPKAKEGIVLRTYKAPDDDTLLVLPCSSSRYQAVKDSVPNPHTLKHPLSEIYADSKTVFRGEWKTK